MAQAKRIVVSLPDSLLQEVDGIVSRETGTRSDFIREAVRRLIEERHRLVEMEKYRLGYEEIGNLNQTLAEDGWVADSSDFENYENYLVKREK